MNKENLSAGFDGFYLGGDGVTSCTQVIYEEYCLEKSIRELLPALRLRGIELGSTEVGGWINRWLRNENGFFWGRWIDVPNEGSVYRVRSLSDSKDNGGGEYTTRFAIGDCHGVIESQSPLPNFFSLQVKKTSNTRCWGELSESKEYSQKFKREFVEYYTANGITGILEDFADTGAALLTEIKPNERLQSELLLCMPRNGLITVKQYPIEPICIPAERNDSSFSYAVDCEKCNGEGVLDCDKCNGTGKSTCSKCKGSVYVSCVKCGGTGKHYSKKGYRYDCSLCGGSGRLVCNRCNGSGEIACTACNGTGITTCYVCNGSSAMWVSYDRSEKKFYRISKNLKFGEKSKTYIATATVYLFKKSERVKKAFSGRWKDITSALKEQYEQKIEVDRNAKELLDDATAVRRCLDKVIELKPDEKSYRPMTIHTPIATTDRDRGRVVYEFSLKGRRYENERFPYPEKMQVKISDKEKRPIYADKKIYFVGYDQQRHVIKLSFPVEIDSASISNNEVQINPAEPKAPEFRQIAYLDEWMDVCRNELLHSLTENTPISVKEAANYFNPRIPKFESQKMAVAYSISNAPITLLQGPPGTGKTTVIVEIIRQMLARGKRVLVTSQTHQAVCNVLEKLHELKQGGQGSNIEMVRYSADESKLTKIEEIYQAGYSEGERLEILNKSESSLAELREKIKEASATVSVYDSMIAIASNMETINGDADEKVNEINSEENESIYIVKDRYNKQRAAAERDYDSHKERLENSIKNISKSIENISEEIRETKKRIALYKTRLSRKTMGSFSDRVWGIFDGLLSTTQSVASLQSELPKEARNLSMHQAKLESPKERKNNFEQEVANLKEAYDHVLNEFDISENSEMATIRNAAKEKIKSVSLERDAKLSPWIAEQERNIANLQTGHLNVNVHMSSADIERIRESAKSLCADLERKEKFKTEWIRELEASPGVLGKFLQSRVKVFMATCVGVGGWKELLNGTYEQDDNEDAITGKPARPKFDLVIIDEAGHATFGETVIPMMFAKRVLMVGDDRQLPPICGEELPCLRSMGSLCESGVDNGKHECWLEYSLFEYLWTRQNRFNVPRLMLDTQFRMHPDIGSFISTAFYEGKLGNGVSSTDRHFIFNTFTKPVCVISTSKCSNRFEVHNGTSYSNELEANYIKKVIEALIGDLTQNPGTQNSVATISLAIITPYSDQVRLLRKKLNEFFVSPCRRLEFTKDDIASVDKFQGAERDIIISSFVRSPKPCNKCNGSGKVFFKKCPACKGKGHKSGSFKFVHDLKRTNVAFSRAKKMLILVGDMDALCRYDGNRAGQEILIDFAKYVSDRGKVLHVWEN